jgi:hypothetical protein
MMGRRPGYMSQKRDACEPLTFAVPTFGRGGLPDSLIRKVLAHPHRGHSLEPPGDPGGFFFGVQVRRPASRERSLCPALSPFTDSLIR